MEEILTSLGLGILLPNFLENKLTVTEAIKLNDAELFQLGITTIGDRIRLREKLKEAVKGQNETQEDSTDKVATHREVLSLFRPRARTSARGRKRVRTWTGNFFCFSDKEIQKVPSSTDKEILQKNGLGNRKIQLMETSTSEEVMQKLIEEFPKLIEAGGFELLRCSPNCRNLVLLNCNWDTVSLRQNVGSQAKIYIRPIQNNLSINEIDTVKDKIEEKCIRCSYLINVRELREHLKICHDGHQAATLPGTSLVENSVAPSLKDGQEATSLPETDLVGNSVTIDYVESDDLTLFINPTMMEELATEEPVLPYILKESTETELKQIVKECVMYCKENNMSDPVSILRKYQSLVVTGRSLDINEETQATGLEGETNFIMIDRGNILPTTFEEIRSLPDLRKCLEVQFYGESAADYGGPRKEFFELVLRQLQTEYFDPVREWSDDYEVIGKIMALSVLQNGRLPRIMSEDIVTEVFTGLEPRPFVTDLRRGLDNLGLVQLARELPTVVHLFTPTSPNPVTLKMVTNLLQPQFSIEGSNKRLRENAVYTLFIKYLREAASGRRGTVNLGSILRFSTGAEAEPALGFSLHPSISFIEGENYIPTANTCINRLTLTIPDGSHELPPQEEMFRLFDFAFCNAFFGLE